MSILFLEKGPALLAEMNTPVCFLQADLIKT